MPSSPSGDYTSAGGWRPPIRLNDLDWEFVVSLPLARFEDFTEELTERDVSDWIEQAMKWRIDARDPSWSDAAHTRPLFQLMQILMSFLELDGRTLSEELKRSESELRMKSDQLERTKEQLDQQSMALAELQEKEVDSAGRWNRVDEDRQALMDDIRELQLELHKARKQHERDGKELSRLRSDVKSLEVEREQQARKEKTRLTETRELLRTHESMSKERGDLVVRFTEALRTIETLSTTKKANERAAKAEITAMREDMESHVIEIKSLKEELEDCMRAKEELDHLVDRRERKAAADLEAIQKEYNVLLGNARDEINSLKAQLRTQDEDAQCELNFKEGKWTRGQNALENKIYEQ